MNRRELLLEAALAPFVLALGNEARAAEDFDLLYFYARDMRLGDPDEWETWRDFGGGPHLFICMHEIPEGITFEDIESRPDVVHAMWVAVAKGTTTEETFPLLRAYEHAAKRFLS